MKNLSCVIRQNFWLFAGIEQILIPERVKMMGILTPRYQSC